MYYFNPGQIVRLKPEILREDLRMFGYYDGEIDWLVENDFKIKDTWGSNSIMYYHGGQDKDYLIRCDFIELVTASKKTGHPLTKIFKDLKTNCTN